MRITWAGMSRCGAGCTGRATVTDLPAWVRAKWRSGWQELEVHAPDGRKAGAIEENPDGSRPRRIWWAEA